MRTMPIDRFGFAAVVMAAAVLCMLAPASAPAASSPSAVALTVSGTVDMVTADGGRRSLKKATRLTYGQVVETGPDGRAVLGLEDGSRVEVYEESRLELDEVLTEEEKKLSFSLVMGYVHLKLKKLVSPNLVVTPTMVAGVRGTEFLVSVADDGASVVSVEKGKVSVSTDKEGEDTAQLDLKPGREVEVDEAGEALRPRDRTIRNVDQARDFRRRRLKKLAANMPAVTKRLNQGIDKILERLTHVSGVIRRKCDNIQKLARKWKEVNAAGGKGQKARQAKLKLAKQLGREIKDLKRLGKVYHVLHVRLKAIFQRIARFQHLLPRMKDQIGPDYPKVEAGLKDVLSRGTEVKAKVKAIDQETREAVKSVRPILKRLQSLQKGRKAAP